MGAELREAGMRATTTSPKTYHPGSSTQYLEAAYLFNQINTPGLSSENGTAWRRERLSGAAARLLTRWATPSAQSRCSPTSQG
jgi:hypothetical protein